MSYRDLEIWQLAKDMSIDIHRMTLQKLPKFEMYETGSQIRRSSKSIRTNIVEGYGRRRYKQDFIRFLTYAQASCDETADHLNLLFETKSFDDTELHKILNVRLEKLGRKITKFIQSVEKMHRSVREEPSSYHVVETESDY